jgi:thiol-disulfide isomerase/thioredoxin
MYHAEWCGSCQALRPKYEEAKKDPRVAHLKFIEIDTDKFSTPDYIETVPAIMKGTKRYDNDPNTEKMIEFFLDS